jgi:hypothetical protein
LGIIERAIGAGRTLTTSYTLVSAAKTVHGAAPFSEAVHAPFEMETVHRDVEKGAPGGIEKSDYRHRLLRARRERPRRTAASATASGNNPATASASATGGAAGSSSTEFNVTNGVPGAGARAWVLSD